MNVERATRDEQDSQHQRNCPLYWVGLVVALFRSVAGLMVEYVA